MLAQPASTRLNSAALNLAKAERIKLLALDVDGVLTDGGLYIGEQGEVFKRFNAQDGMGISCALRSNLIIALITGRQSEIVSRRAAELGITEIYQGVKDKKGMLRMLAEKYALNLTEVAYMGDDLNDLPVFSIAGLACAPANAVSEVKSSAHFVSSKCGGDGAVREVIEAILKARGLWAQLVADYANDGQGDCQ